MPLRLLLVLACLSLFSCAKLGELYGRKAGSTEVRVGASRSRISTLSGGILVYALKSDGTRQAVQLADSSTLKTLSLSNGTYSFYAVGWDSANLTGPSSPNKPQCAASSTYELTGTATDVDLVFSQAKCADSTNFPIFSHSAALASGTFANLSLTFCWPDNDQTGATAAGGCALSQGPYIGSYKVRMIAYGPTSATATPIPDGGISSTCQTGPVSDGSVRATNGVKIPVSSSGIASPFATAIDIYPQSEDCSTDATTVVFPHGLVNGTPGYTTKLVGNGAGSLSLHLNSAIQFTFNFTNGQAAVGVIGQPDFITNNAATPTQSTTGDIAGVHVDTNGNLRVSDYVNSRILGFSSVPESAGPNANFVLGQPNFTSSTQGNSSSTYTFPNGLASYGSKFAISDGALKRVLIHNSIPTANGDAANVVTGHTSLSGTGTGACSATTFDPQTISMGGGRMAVADHFNNRVLLYNAIPTSNGAAADVTLGDVSCASGLTAQAFNNPRGVWTDGTRLLVTDTINYRVLVWNTWPTTNSQAPDLVLGQPDFTTANGSVGQNTLYYPHSVWSNGTQIIVADKGANRVLIWNSWPTANQAPASQVLGQSTFFGASQATTADGFNGPQVVHAWKNYVFVGELYNKRLMIFKSN